MKSAFLDWADDSLDYWLTVALAVFSVWRAGQVDDDRSSLFLLFAAAYLLIHAHGRRILAAVKKNQETSK